MTARDSVAFKWRMAVQSLNRPYPVTIAMIVLVSLVPFYIFIAHAVPGRTQASALNDVIARLSNDTVDQEAGGRYTRVHTESQHMQPISRVAREVFGASGMDRAFRMPTLSTVNQTLLAAAGAMAEAAAKARDVFVRHGLPQDFIEQLRASATALETARTAKTESGRRRVTATAAVKDQVRRGKQAVRLLNAIPSPRLAQDAELRAAWRSAKRVRPTSAASAPGEMISSPAIL